MSGRQRGHDRWPQQSDIQWDLATAYDQLFLRATELKEKDGADYAFRVLKAQGQSIIKEGKALEGDDANLAELRAQHEAFTAKRLPLLKALGIA